VLLGVSFAGVVSVITGVARVATSSVSVMGGLLVLPALMMLGCFVVMTSGMAVMLGCFAMMFGSFFRHRRISRLLAVWAKKITPGSLGSMEKSTSVEFGSWHNARFPNVNSMTHPPAERVCCGPLGRVYGDIGNSPI
jgi:hypothetical protein